MGNKKPVSAFAKTGSQILHLALATFILRLQAELKSAHTGNITFLEKLSTHSLKMGAAALKYLEE